MELDLQENLFYNGKQQWVQKIMSFLISCIYGGMNRKTEGERRQDGFGGDFTIMIHSDSTFSYYEGMLSSRIGLGNWKLEGDILCLEDNGQKPHSRVNYFKVDGDSLIFQSEGSSNFIYVSVADGERFSAEDSALSEK